MSKLNKILLVLVIVLIVALGVIIYWQKVGFEGQYWAVYMNTGDLYFGKISRFPRLHLSDVWFIQRNPQDNQNPLSLSQFKMAFWGPEDDLYLNEQNIVWKTKLNENSQVVSFIKSPQAAQSSQPPQSRPSQPQGTSTQQ